LWERIQLVFIGTQSELALITLRGMVEIFSEKFCLTP
jgi:hypothetical protein